MKKLLIITLGIFIFGIISFKVFSSKIVKDASALENTFIEVKNIPDGSYKGHSELGPVIIDVNVIIKDGKIINIELLKHQNGFGNAANTIVKNMVQKNTSLNHFIYHFLIILFIFFFPFQDELPRYCTTLEKFSQQK